MNRPQKEKLKGLLNALIGNYPVQLKMEYAKTWKKEAQLSKLPLYGYVISIHQSGAFTVQCDETSAVREWQLDAISAKFLKINVA